MYKVLINNLLEMDDFSKRLADILTGDEIIILEGELASGKTTFASFLAKNLGVKELVNSPSYTIYKRYTSGKYIFNHFDLYRLKKLDTDFDLMDYYDLGITLIEWASNIPEIIPEEHLKIIFKKKGIQKRELKIIAEGKKYKELLKCIK